MGVGLGVTVARSQESDVENKRIEQGEYLDDEADPHPSDLIPFASHGHDGREEPPVEISGDDKPHCGEHQYSRPRTRQRQHRAQHVDCADDKNQRPKKLKSGKRIGVHVIWQQCS